MIKSYGCGKLIANNVYILIERSYMHMQTFRISTLLNFLGQTLVFP